MFPVLRRTATPDAAATAHAPAGRTARLNTLRIFFCFDTLLTVAVSAAVSSRPGAEPPRKRSVNYSEMKY
jgi:hypothetical protein